MRMLRGLGLIVVNALVYMYRLRGLHLAIIALLTCALAIVAGWLYKCRFGRKNNTDNRDECLIHDIKTKKEAGVLFGGCWDVWHVYHVLFWAIIGQLVPSAPYGYGIVILLSIGWESIEHVYFRSTGICTNAVCGRIEDPFLNLIGYTIGSAISAS